MTEGIYIVVQIAEDGTVDTVDCTYSFPGKMNIEKVKKCLERKHKETVVIRTHDTVKRTYECTFESFMNIASEVKDTEEAEDTE